MRSSFRKYGWPSFGAANGTATRSAFAVELKLNGQGVGMVHPNQLFFFDRPPGNYTVAAIHPGTLGFGGFDGHINPMGAPATEHTLTFHVNAGQVRYIRWGTRASYEFVTQVYPQLVDVAIGQAQTEEILNSGGFKIKSISKR